MKKAVLLIICLSSLYAARAITVIRSTGWLESASVTWEPVKDTKIYEVSYTGEGFTDKKIDMQLIRSYGSYFRADAVGLKAGNYTLKITAIDSVGVRTDSTVTQTLTVLPHDRSGFGFSTQSPAGNSSGAYAGDGTLRSGAKVIYLCETNTQSVTLDVITSSGGAVNSCTRIGTILKARQKGYDSTPLAIRIIGKVSDGAMLAAADALGSDNDLQVKGARAYTELNTTIEGIGNDAVAFGWGILVRNCKNIEIRNLAFMEFPEDGVSLNTDNANIWVHHCDFFYGKRGSGDKEKGDGSLDSKESGWVTLSYNHFWDSGKCNLLGNGTEEPEYLTYHHNWYDHSDSRHPRVRFHTVHVYNNYYDGIAKYGIGAAAGCPNIFTESNYFHNCKYPMLISMQGSDIAGGEGTFSSENGGMIKAFGNHIDGAAACVPYSSNSVNFDFYDATSRTEQVPAAVVSRQGNCAYSNFDTDPAIFGAGVYPCIIDSADDVPLKVRNSAGRMEGGDISFTFTASDNSNYAIMPALEALVRNYAGTLVYIQGIDKSSSGEGGNGEDEGGNNGEGSVAGEGGNLCALISTGNTSGFAITGNTSDSKGSVTVNSATYSCCLKMETATGITFTTAEAKTLTLIFLAGESGKKVKINDVDHTVDSGGQLKTQLAAGTHKISKGDAINLFYIALASPTETAGLHVGSVSYLNNKIHNPEKRKITLFDIAGKKIANFNTDFDTGAFPKGIYMLEIQGEKALRISK